MKVLIGCEESQAVCIAFRERGFEAYSCDLQPCSGGHPEWHIQCDIRDLLKEYFDLVVFHPDCTYIANSGVSWMYRELGRWKKMFDACDFFSLRHKFNSPCVATENPIPHIYAKKLIGNYTQLIQPYQFGHKERKATCFWLKGLPPLAYTDNVYSEMKLLPANQQQRLHYLPPGPERAKMRSKTYRGFAEAMAAQWGAYIKSKQAA